MEAEEREKRAKTSFRADLFFFVPVRGGGGMLPLRRIPPDLNLRNKLSHQLRRERKEAKQQQKWPPSCSLG